MVPRRTGTDARGRLAAPWTNDGTLIEANAGFLRLISVEGSSQSACACAWFFIQPDFATLYRVAGGEAPTDKFIVAC